VNRKDENHYRGKPGTVNGKSSAGTLEFREKQSGQIQILVVKSTHTKRLRSTEREVRSGAEVKGAEAGTSPRGRRPTSASSGVSRLRPEGCRGHCVRGEVKSG